MRCAFLMIILFCSLLLGGIAGAQNVKDSVPDIVYKWYPKYVTFLPGDKLDSVLVYANTDLVPVIYKVNKYDLKGSPQLDSIVNLINQIKSDSRVELAYVWVGGSASPEGPVAWNKKLGDYRSAALSNFLRSKTDLPDEQLRVENLGEDWYSVTRTLEKIDFPNKEKILDIIESEPDWNSRKNKIRAIDNGQTWRRLVREIFPVFRNSRMVIVCSADGLKYRTHKSVPLVLQVPDTVCPMLSIPMIETKLRPQPENRFWSVKTNTLFLAALVANVGVEVELWKKWSLDVPVWYSPYNITSTRKIRLMAVQPEIRHWLKKAGEGHFFGLHTHVAGFNVAINDNGRYQDPNHALWGMGLSYGYATHISKNKRWSLEFNLGVGFAEYDYDAYRNWANGPKFRSGSDWYWGITRAGISISYKWYKERKNKN